MHVQLKRINLNPVTQNFIFHIESVKIQESVRILHLQKRWIIISLKDFILHMMNFI